MEVRNKMIIQISYIAELYGLQISSIDFRTIRNNTMLEVNFFMQRFKEEVEKFKSENFNTEAEQIGAAIYD